MKNTLFLLTSVDGKITTGLTPSFDFDKDFAEDSYLNKGLQQYYDIEKTTDIWSVISSNIAVKLGAEEGKYPANFIPVNFVVIGNKLSTNAMESIAANCNSVIFVMTDRVKFNIRMRQIRANNVSFLYYDVLDPVKMFKHIYEDRHAEAVTIQTGGTLNRLFFAHKCINYIDIVVAPTIVGGSNTTSMVSGWDRVEWNDLEALPHLEVIEIVRLKDNYVRMRYKVIDENE